jgi:hypothetical protein
MMRTRAYDAAVQRPDAPRVPITHQIFGVRLRLDARCGQGITEM